MAPIVSFTVNELFDDFPSVPPNQVQALFDLWVSLYRQRSSTVVLTDKRKKKILQALKSHGYETCEQAIRGIQYSSFHMGDNANDTVYTDIELILRDAAKIERFADLYKDNT